MNTLGHIDLRDWLKAVESHGDLKHVKGANCVVERDVHEIRFLRRKPLFIRRKTIRID